ncbi:MAG: NYN domain-containing protein, partial [Nitrococcus sp.]|nr:NYN domain-containing protein [Nitrococcus sp.]
MRRVIVFWDYTNFHATLRSLSGGTFPGAAQFDFIKFVEQLSKESELVKIYFACSSSRDAESVQGFFEYLDWQPHFYVKQFETRRRDGNDGVEKQVDVYIASQMVALAYENAYDHAILISGDEDYVPALEIVHQ